MEQRLIGREAELKLLNEYINSDKSEFIAVYGRRRVGKTFLIRKAVEDHFAFFMTGMNGVAKGEQLVNFSIALQKYIFYFNEHKKSSLKMYKTTKSRP